MCVCVDNVVYLCHKSFPAVPFHRHGEVEPGPGIVMVLQTGQNQVQVLPVHTTLFSLSTTFKWGRTFIQHPKSVRHHYFFFGLRNELYSVLINWNLREISNSVDFLLNFPLTSPTSCLHVCLQFHTEQVLHSGFIKILFLLSY